MSNGPEPLGWLTTILSRLTPQRIYPSPSPPPDGRDISGRGCGGGECRVEVDGVSGGMEEDGRIGWDEYFMSMAVLASSRSSCSRLHVGCVLAKDRRCISMGYNGFLPNVVHQSIIRDGHEQATIHAETNAVLDCARRGVCTTGAIAYITHYPCLNCYKMLVGAGISKIYYLYDYHNDDVITQLNTRNGPEHRLVEIIRITN